MGRETEIIFVDGNSTDGTSDEIENQIKKHPKRKIRLIHQGTGRGKGDAVRKGFAAATGDVLVIQDADLPLRLKICRNFLLLSGTGKANTSTALGSFIRWKKRRCSF